MTDVRAQEPSRIVLAVGASHSTLMNTHWDQVEHVDRAEAFRDALAAARDEIAAARPDVVVVVGSNHFRGFWLDLIPSFTFGVGEVIASGEAGTPSGPQRVDPPVARHLVDAVVGEDFDAAFSVKLQIDHGQTHAIQYLLDGLDVPVVPLVVNVFAPPLPSLQRCWDLGEALGRAVASLPGGRRVVVVGSGGLSHRLPFPKWQEPKDEDQEYLVEAWTEGRGRWKDYDVRRRQITLSQRADLNPDFDRTFLADFAGGRARQYTSWTTEKVDEVAGNGAQEIRTWLVAAAAAGTGGLTEASGAAPTGEVLAYGELPEWLTGMGVAVLRPTAARSAASTALSADSTTTREPA